MKTKETFKLSKNSDDNFLTVIKSDTNSKHITKVRLFTRSEINEFHEILKYEYSHTPTSKKTFRRIKW